MYVCVCGGVCTCIDISGRMYVGCVCGVCVEWTVGSDMANFHDQLRTYVRGPSIWL